MINIAISYIIMDKIINKLFDPIVNIFNPPKIQNVYSMLSCILTNSIYEYDIDTFALQVEFACIIFTDATIINEDSDGYLDVKYGNMVVYVEFNTLVDRDRYIHRKVSQLRHIEITDSDIHTTRESFPENGMFSVHKSLISHSESQ